MTAMIGGAFCVQAHLTALASILAAHAGAADEDGAIFDRGVRSFGENSDVTCFSGTIARVQGGLAFVAAEENHVVVYGVHYVGADDDVTAGNRIFLAAGVERRAIADLDCVCKIAAEHRIGNGIGNQVVATRGDADLKGLASADGNVADLVVAGYFAALCFERAAFVDYDALTLQDDFTAGAYFKRGGGYVDRGIDDVCLIEGEIVRAAHEPSGVADAAGADDEAALRVHAGVFAEGEALVVHEDHAAVSGHAAQEVRSVARDAVQGDRAAIRLEEFDVFSAGRVEAVPVDDNTRRALVDTCGRRAAYGEALYSGGAGRGDIGGAGSGVGYGGYGSGHRSARDDHSGDECGEAGNCPVGKDGRRMQEVVLLAYCRVCRCGRFLMLYWL